MVTAGQQDTRFRLREPVLWHDLVAMAAPVTKWSVQAESAGELPELLHRAFKVAQDPPTGPVFVALPFNVMNERTSHGPIPPSRIWRRAAPDPDGVEEAARLVLAAERPVVFAGDRVAQSGAGEELIALAGADRGRRARGRPAGAGERSLPPPLRARARALGDHAQVRAAAGDADLVLLVGGEFFEEVWYVEDAPFPEGAPVIQIDSSARNLGRNHRLDCGLFADPKLALGALLAALEAGADEAYRTGAAARMERLRARKEAEAEAHRARAERPPPGNRPMQVARAMQELAKAAPEGVAVAREAITAGHDLVRSFDFRAPGDAIGSRGGGIGQGLPSGIGLKLAFPDRPVLCVSGDGSALYTIQALWTAAHHRVPVVFVIVNNRVYRILKYNMNRFRAIAGVEGRGGSYRHLDLTDPDIDYVSVAQGFGVEGPPCHRPRGRRSRCRGSLRERRPPPHRPRESTVRSDEPAGADATVTRSMPRARLAREVRMRLLAGVTALALPVLGSASAEGLPGPVEEALARHRLPTGSLSVFVQDVGAPDPPLVSHRADVPRHPASTIKLLTTLAALEELGPAWKWETGVYVTGPVQGGRLEGDLVLTGSGDPYLVVEQLWRLLAAVRARGLREVAGRLVIDNTRFSVEDEPPPGDFDGKPYRAYNAPPDAFLVNFNAFDVVVEARAGGARAWTEPPVAGLRVRSRLAGPAGGCARRALRLEVSGALSARSPLDAPLPGPHRGRTLPARLPACGVSALRAAPGPVCEWSGAGAMERDGGADRGRVRGRPGSRRCDPLASPPLAAARPRRPRGQQVQQQRDVSQPAADPGGGALRTSRDDGQGAPRGRRLARAARDRPPSPPPRERGGVSPATPGSPPAASGACSSPESAAGSARSSRRRFRSPPSTGPCARASRATRRRPGPG